MIPPIFDYLRPKTVPEAIALLQQYGDDAKILSGGQSLIPMMKLRLARPAYLIDINRIAGLSYVKEEGGYLKIGGLTREAELESFAADSLEVSDHSRYRSRHCRSAGAEHGDGGRQPGTRRSGQRSSGHHAGAWCEGRGYRTAGERVIPIDDFFVSLFTTALQPRRDCDGDSNPSSARAQRWRVLQAGAQGRRLCHRGGRGAGDAGCRRSLPEGRHRSDQCRSDADQGDEGGRFSARQEAGRSKHLRQAAQLAADEAQPSSDLRGPVEYKTGLVKELASRALTRAVERAGK